MAIHITIILDNAYSLSIFQTIFGDFPSLHHQVLGLERIMKTEQSPEHCLENIKDEILPIHWQLCLTKHNLRLSVCSELTNMNAIYTYSLVQSPS